jgi:hypothetical protein
VLEAIFDTVVVNHLLRKIQVKKRRRTAKGQSINALGEIELGLRRKALKIIADKSNGLISEWHQTCGEEKVKQLVIKWQEFDGIRLVQPTASITPHRVALILRQHGFTDTVDKLIIRTALANGLKTVIVSIDSDFWDPADPRRVGDRNAPVALTIRTRLKLSVVVTPHFLQTLRTTRASGG